MRNFLIRTIQYVLVDVGTLLYGVMYSKLVLNDDSRPLNACFMFTVQDTMMKLFPFSSIYMHINFTFSRRSDQQYFIHQSFKPFFTFDLFSYPYIE